MLIHWYNPENDLALATAEPNYTPKRLALRMREAGAALPMWYGDPGDKMLCYGVNERWWQQMTDRFGIEVDIFDHNPKPNQIPTPWGWSAYAKKHFINQGFSRDVLPSDAAIQKIRELSHRRTSIEIVRRLRELLPHIAIAPPAYEASSIEDVEIWMLRHDGTFVKHPWSSSGRGVVDSRITTDTAIARFAADGIGRQGSVMLEQAYDRVIDFAKLYRCRGGKCTSVGTSVFNTDSKSSYTGNLLATEAECVEAVTKYISNVELQQVAEALRIIIEGEIAPYYDGILGIDMIIDTDGLLAVMELNLRMTMGYVARSFADKHLAPGARGSFRVVPMSALSEALISTTKNADTLGCVIEDRRLISGSMLLTPQNPYFAYLVEATCLP